MGDDHFKCRDCAYYAPTSCRRRSPVGDAWPSVTSEDWCGEWRDQFDVATLRGGLKNIDRGIDVLCREVERIADNMP